MCQYIINTAWINELVRINEFVRISEQPIKSYCYMVVGNFKGTDGVPKTMSCLAAHLQWNIRFVSWLNPVESLWRAS